MTPQLNATPDNDALVNRVQQLEADLLRRDLCEFAAACVVLTAFAVSLYSLEMPWVARVGVAIMMFSVVQAVAVLIWVRITLALPAPDASLFEYCRIEQARVQRQIHLLRHVNRWYSGPLLLGCGVMLFGLIRPLFELSSPAFYGFLGSFYVCLAVAGWIIYRMNQRAVTTELAPLAEELSQVLQSPSEPSSPDTVHPMSC